MLPDEIDDTLKDIYHFQHQYTLNDIEIMLKEEGATEELILDLCDLTDILNNHLVKDIKVKY